MTNPAAWLAVIVMILIIGSWLIWLHHERDKTRSAEAEAEWKQLLEPNRNGDLIPHTPPDIITERPILPDDYKEWNFR